VRDLEDCCLAASAPVAITGGRHNAQNTKSVTVALSRVILVDRSGFAIPPNKQRGFPPKSGAPRRRHNTNLPSSTMSEKIRRKDDLVPWPHWTGCSRCRC
jgi:hypothetical protein